MSEQWTEALRVYIDTLQATLHLDPVEQVRACPGLITEGQRVISQHRALASLVATTDHTDDDGVVVPRISQLELARRLGVSRQTVTSLIALARELS